MYIHVFNNDWFSQYQIRLYSPCLGLNGGENHCISELNEYLNHIVW